MNDAHPESAWGRRARAVRGKFSFPAVQRPVVLIQSDDWGRTGAPDRRCIDELRRAGLNVGQSPWDLYGLETEDDLERLGGCLEKIRDRDGNPACVTANFVMANADLRRMREQGYREFLWKSIDEGFPEPWTDSLAPAYRRLVARRRVLSGAARLHAFQCHGADGVAAGSRAPRRGGTTAGGERHSIPGVAHARVQFRAGRPYERYGAHAVGRGPATVAAAGHRPLPSACSVSPRSLSAHRVTAAIMSRGASQRDWEFGSFRPPDDRFRGWTTAAWSSSGTSRSSPYWTGDADVAGA